MGPIMVFGGFFTAGAAELANDDFTALDSVAGLTADFAAAEERSREL